MAIIVFENRAVAFIDVLGFGPLVNNTAADKQPLSELQSLVSLLDSAIPTLNLTVSTTVPQELIPKHIYISDCIILSAPLTCTLPGWESYNGVDIVVMRSVQISHMFMNAGYILRGGISAGLVWHSESNIVGPAYQEAYCLEETTEQPRIVLSPNAQTFWQTSTCASSRMCINYDGQFMVNGLHDYYAPSQFNINIEEVYEKYLSIAKNKIASNLPADAIAKWKWMADYIASERKLSFGQFS